MNQIVLAGTSTDAYGYNKDSGIGQLAPDDTDFLLGTVTHTVEAVQAATGNHDDHPEGELAFRVDVAPSARDAANLSLRVCGETYAFADAVSGEDGKLYAWRNAGLDWEGLQGQRHAVVLSLRPNAAAAGAPAVSGTAAVGATLTALTDGISDPDGLSDRTFSYQWIRVDGADADIDGETGETYTLVADDGGKQVKVAASFTDDRLNAETLTSAAFPATETVASVPSAVAVWSATLTARDDNGVPGCSSTDTDEDERCSNTDTLTDDDFILGGTTRTIASIQVRSGGLIFNENPDIPSARLPELVLTVTEGTDETELLFEDRESGVNWYDAGLSWSVGDEIGLSIESRPEPPVFEEAEVAATGDTIELTFSEDLDQDNLPASGRFAVELDEGTATATVEADDSSGSVLALSVSPRIQKGRTVRLTYVDPTTGNDANAVQDVLGNDAATFQRVPVVNGSELVGVPGPPGNLAATAVGGTRIDLTWAAPDDVGNAPIEGYRIEWSADGGDPWQDIESDTGSTARSYSDTGLASETTRHYRVSAINSFGTGGPSDAATATTDDILGPVPVSATAAATTLTMVFDEALDPLLANLAPASAFAVTADGNPVAVGGRQLNPTQKFVRLTNLDPQIRSGQTVSVAYTDPTPGDDARAIQDDDGNDAASFTRTATNDSTVQPSAPGRPHGARRRRRDADVDPADVERARRHRRPGDHRVPDRGLRERLRRGVELERRRGGHQLDRHDLRAHRPPRRRDPHVPGLGDQHDRDRPAVGHRHRHDGRSRGHRGPVGVSRHGGGRRPRRLDPDRDDPRGRGADRRSAVHGGRRHRGRHRGSRRARGRRAGGRLHRRAPPGRLPFRGRRLPAHRRPLRGDPDGAGLDHRRRGGRGRRDLRDRRGDQDRRRRVDAGQLARDGRHRGHRHVARRGRRRPRDGGRGRQGGDRPDRQHPAHRGRAVRGAVRRRRGPRGRRHGDRGTTTTRWSPPAPRSASTPATPRR